MNRLYTATELQAARLPPREFLLDPLISTQSLALLYGPRGLGKTFVALGIAWAVASGGSFLGWRAERPRSVVYLDGEMTALDMRERLALLGPSPDNLRFLMSDLGAGPEAMPDLAKVGGWTRLRAMLGGAFPDLVVIDNLATLVGIHSRDPDPWRDLQRILLTLRRMRKAVLIVHHANKRGDQRGTSKREDLLDLVLAIRRPADYRPRDGARFELHFEKARSLFGTVTDAIEAQLAADIQGRPQWTWRKAADCEIDRVAALLRDGMNPNQIARELGISKSKAYRLRDQTTTLPPA
jgi:hypothetical protein